MYNLSHAVEGFHLFEESSVLYSNKTKETGVHVNQTFEIQDQD